MHGIQINFNDFSERKHNEKLDRVTTSEFLERASAAGKSAYQPSSSKLEVYLRKFSSPLLCSAASFQKVPPKSSKISPSQKENADGEEFGKLKKVTACAASFSSSLKC